jgi:hypothetical protein
MSSHIQVELDALHRAADIAALTGMRINDAIAGLVQLWAECYRFKTSTISDALLRAKFQGLDVGRVLADLGFLERTEDGWHVKGTGRYTRAQEACSKGGHAAKGNLIPGGPKAAAKRSAAAETKPRRSRRAAEGQPSMLLGSTSALDPRSEIRDPKETTFPAPPDGEPVKASPPTVELRDRLAAVFAQERGGVEYGFQGGRDGKAVAELLALCRGDMAEAERRWRRALRRDGYPRASHLHELRTHWNAYATDQPTSNGKSPVALTQESNAALSHVGEVQW